MVGPPTVRVEIPTTAAAALSSASGEEREAGGRVRPTGREHVCSTTVHAATSPHGPHTTQILVGSLLVALATQNDPTGVSGCGRTARGSTPSRATRSPTRARSRPRAPHPR